MNKITLINKLLIGVSIIIPTKNSGNDLVKCLSSIRKQIYPNIEIIIVDSNSRDLTAEIARRYSARLFIFTSSKTKKNLFDAPDKRNFGVLKSHGKYVYIMDADMELPAGIISEAVELCEKDGYDALIFPEDSEGEGIWAKAKQLERRCYWGDDTVEAPRFIRKTSWDNVGGLDTSIGGGGDDWDLYQKLKENGYKVGRTKNIVINHEGRINLIGLCRKRFRYGRESVNYVIKRPRAGFSSYFPIRMAFIRHWKDFMRQPLTSILFIIMRFMEYSAGFAGIIYSYVK